MTPVTPHRAMYVDNTGFVRKCYWLINGLPVFDDPGAHTEDLQAASDANKQWTSVPYKAPYNQGGIQHIIDYGTWHYQQDYETQYGDEYQSVAVEGGVAGHVPTG